LSTFHEILKSLKDKKYAPVYWLDGEEDYFIDALTDYAVKHILEPHERDFNLTILYAQDVGINEVEAAVKRYPMMAERQVVVLKELQNWKNLDSLEPLISKPVPTTVFIVNLRRKMDKRTSLYKTIAKNAMVLDEIKLYENTIGKWVSDHCAMHGIPIEQRAIAVLTDNLGVDLTRLVNSIEMLEILRAGKGTITADMVYQYVGIDRNYNVYELRRALSTRNGKLAMRIAQHFARYTKEHYIGHTVTSVAHFFAQILRYQANHKKLRGAELARVVGIAPRYLDEIARGAAVYSQEQVMAGFEVLSDIDLKSKGVGAANADPGELTMELIARILRL
jgi:DNA polymerase-3 subunit delta